MIKESVVNVSGQITSIVPASLACDFKYGLCRKYTQLISSVFLTGSDKYTSPAVVPIYPVPIFSIAPFVQLMYK